MFWRDQRSQFNKDTFSKKFSPMEVLHMYLPFVRRYFQQHQWIIFFFMAQITPNQTRPNKILLFSEMPLSERTKITVWEWHLVKKILINKSFWFVSTLRKKVFSGALVKFFPFYGPNNSDFVVFGNAAFAEIKDHSLKTTSKKIYMKILSVFLPYVKRHCQGHQWRDFLFTAQTI